jgi:hypothetical protein
VAGVAIFWWRRGYRLNAALCLAWAALAVAAGYQLLGSVPSGTGLGAAFSAEIPVCFAGDPSPSVALSDLPPEAAADPNTPECRSMARAYVAIAAGVIAVSLLLLVLSVSRLRHPGLARSR